MASFPLISTVEVVSAVSPSLSVAVAATVKSKPSVPSGTVSVKPSRSSAPRVQPPSPLSMPAESAAPSGKSKTTMLRLSEPSTSVSSAAMISGYSMAPTPVVRWT